MKTTNLSFMRDIIKKVVTTSSFEKKIDRVTSNQQHQSDNNQNPQGERTQKDYNNTVQMLKIDGKNIFATPLEIQTQNWTNLPGFYYPSLDSHEEQYRENLKENLEKKNKEERKENEKSDIKVKSAAQQIKLLTLDTQLYNQAYCKTLAFQNALQLDKKQYNIFQPNLEMSFDFQQSNQPDQNNFQNLDASEPMEENFNSLQSLHQQSGQKKQKCLSSQEDLTNYASGFKVKYKTEICRNWEQNGFCEFQDYCSFAHGRQELQQKVHVPQNYKTRLCKSYHENMYCPYGVRCQFLHSEKNQKQKKGSQVNYQKKLEQNMELAKEKLLAIPMKPEEQVQMIPISANQVTFKSNDELDNLNVFGKGKRLPVFSGITTTGNELKKSGKNKKNKKKKNINKGGSNLSVQDSIVHSTKSSQDIFDCSSLLSQANSVVTQQLKKMKKKKIMINSGSIGNDMIVNSQKEFYASNLTPRLLQQEEQKQYQKQ